MDPSILSSGIRTMEKVHLEKVMSSTNSDNVKAEVGPPAISVYEVSDTESESNDHEAFKWLAINYPSLGMDDVESVYLCTPMQEAILVSQTQGTNDYIIQASMAVHSLNGYPMDIKRLEMAWTSIVQQSSILRTVFVPSTSGKSLFWQVVLKTVATEIRQIDNESHESFFAQQPEWENGRIAPHRLTFCKTPDGPDYVKVELHHGIADAVASLTIFQELMRLYDNPQSELRGPSFHQFLQHLDNTPKDGKLEHWKNFLHKAQPSIFPRLQVGEPPQRPDERQKLDVTLPRQGILGLVSSSPVSFSMFFHAAWSVLLRAYLGRDDVMFGYISSGRHKVPLPNVSEALGPYISIMVNRAQIEESSTLVQLANQLKKNVSNNLAHEHCSLASIQQQMKSNGGLFNTLVDVQRRPKLTQTSSEIYLDLVHVHTVSEYDIVLNVEDTGSELLAKFDYAARLLSKPDVENLASCFLSIVDLFLKSPEGRIHEMELSSSLHRTQILEWNGSPLTVASACAHDLIEAEAARHPDAEALCSLEVSLTYQELSHLSERLAKYLISAGAGPGSMIPFCMEKSPWAIVTMLAIMKCGAAFVPVDPAAPPSRMNGIISDTNAKLIVTSQAALPPLADIRKGPRLVVVDEALLGTVQTAPELLFNLPIVECQEAAYVLFTSGSTGKPKGVVVPHQSLCSSMYRHGPALGINQTTRSLQFSSYTFDAVIAEVLTVLLHGGTVCVPSEADRMNNVAHAINEMSVNWAMLMPTFVRLLDPSLITTLRTLVLAGEAVDRDCLDTWIGKVNLFNGYGPTETCVVCVATCFSEDSTTSHDIIGKPTGCRAWIVNPTDHNILCPVGAVGELVIEGPNVTQGYLGDPEKTCKSFIDAPNWSSEFFPHLSQRPFRFYKTGDLVRQLSDGSLKFSGRIDSQVKVNGQRLEPGEIEHHALLSNFVMQILVDVPKSGKLRGRLVAVLVLQSTHAAGDASSLQLVVEEYWASATGLLAQLCDKLESTLPAYMVPKTWIPVQQVPLLPSGKMDRRGIKEWLVDMDTSTFQQISDLQSIESGTPYNSEEGIFSDETARQMRTIWCDVLNVPEQKIGARRPFLAFGGDSISAMRVVSKARLYGLTVSVRDILKYGTINDLMPYVRRIDSSQQASRRPQQVEGTPFALTPIQMLHLDAVPRGTNHFNQSFLLELKKPTEPDAIQRAVSSLVRRHSMLRARFCIQSDRKWWQTITDSQEWRFNVVQSQESESLNLLIPLLMASQKSLNIEHGPVLSVDLVALGGERQYLYMVAHHLVIDLVSWRTLFDELEDELRSQKSLSPIPPSFQNWAFAQYEQAAKFRAPDVLPYKPHAPNFEYWNMSGRPNLYGNVTSRTFSLDDETTSILMGAANNGLRTQPVELVMGIILHAFHTVFSDRSVPTLWTETHGRQGWSDDLDLDVSRTVGWFTSIYPICVNSDGCTDVLQTIRRVKDAKRNIPNHGLDYFTSRYLDKTGREPFQSDKDMEILFNYQGLYQQLERDDSLLSNVSRSKFDFPSDVAEDVPRLSLIDIFSGVENGTFTVTFTWSPDMARQEDIKSWVTDCECLLQYVARSTVKEPLASLSDYPLLPFTYQELDNSLQNLTRQWSLTSLDEIEDIYPCSPSQEGIIVSQIRQPERNLYNFETTWKVTSRSGTSLDVDRLEAACCIVIQRHQILRTVFCESDVADAPFFQVVLKNAAILGLPLSRSNIHPGHLVIPAPNILSSHRFPYHWTLCETSDGVYFKFVINHCLLDGSSLGLLVQDIYSAYDNIQLSAAPLYSSFIGHLLGNPTDASYAFWNRRLDDVGCCHFPTLAGEGPTEVSFDRVDIPFTKDQVDGIRKLCRELGVTLATTMSAIWALVLQAYIGNDAQTICFGYMASGRDVPLSGVHEMMGPLLNMLVQRVDFNPLMSVSELLTQVHNSVVASIPHQHCSLAKIQSSMGLKGETLFNTLVNVQKRTKTDLTQSEQPIQMVITDYHDPAEFDLIVNVVDTSEGVTANLHFWNSCITMSQAHDVKETFLKVVDSFLQSTSTPVTQVDLLAEHHRRQLLEWNPVIPHSVDSCLHHLFDAQVAHRPDAPAVCTTGSEGNWTYTEIDDLASRLASHLSSLGVGPEVTVPFCFDKSPWTVVVILATLKAGGACLALDPLYPIQRLHHMIDMTKATVVVTQEHHADKFRDVQSLSIISVTPGLWDRLESRSLSGHPVKPNNAAFINFTSGSTGVPKGSVLEHRSICSALWHHHKLDPVGKDTRALQFCSYTFDASFAEILLTLCYGGCLCVPTEDERMNRLEATITDLDINWAYLTPTVTGLLDPTQVPSLKTLCLGGEPVLDSLVRKWLHKVRIIATYGPSECSIAISRSEVQKFGNGQLGPASGALLWIVDSMNPDRLVPIGCPGELLIEGPLVGRGYLQQDHNDASFVVDPQWAKSFPIAGLPSVGRRMYKTGDIVRFVENGSMVMLGRKDAQLKIHGQRVDLDEVEHHLTVDSEIRHAACLLPKGGPFAGKLTAIVSTMELADATFGVVKNGMEVMQGPDTQSQVLKLRSCLEERAPAYMIPRVWVMAKTVPVTFNGKLNRRALLHMLETVDKDTYEAILSIDKEVIQTGMSAMEEQLRDAWAHVLNIPESHISPSRSFFSLGGDSISAIQVSARLRGQGIGLSMHDIMRYRSITEIAKYARRVQVAPVALADESLGTLFPLSPIQRSYFTNMPTEQDRYNQSFMLRIKRPIECATLLQALKAIVSRHSMLRARFKQNEDGQWAQIVTDEVESSLIFNVTPDMQSLYDTEPILQKAQDGLDISNGPVFSAQLLGLQDDSWYLCLIAHHLVVDLVSWRIILEDLEQALESTGITTHTSIPFQSWVGLQVSYAQSVDGLEVLSPQNVIHSKVETADLSYWGVPDARSYGTTVFSSFELDSDTTTALLGGANQVLDTEPVEIFMAAVLDAFHTVFPQRKVPTLFAEGHGREPWNTDIDVSRTVGWFTTMYPICIDRKSADQSFVSTLRLVKDASRNIPAKGWRYFTSRHLTPAGQKAFAEHGTMEILFNHLGQYQQLERDDALFEQAILPYDMFDFGPSIPRAALFEIVTVVDKGKLTFKLSHSSELKHHDSIQQWVQACRNSLINAGDNLLRWSLKKPLPTFSDFPLLAKRLKYDDLDRIFENIGANMSTIEDIYPCSPMQEGILISRTRQQGLYDTYNTWKLVPRSGSDRVDKAKLGDAITQVISRHQALRTWFIECEGTTPYVQVVWKEVAPPILYIDAPTAQDFIELMPSGNSNNSSDSRLGYRFIICEPAAGETLCRMEINHALIDGLSMQVLIGDILRAYDGLLTVDSMTPRYGDFISYLESHSREAGLAYWTSLLEDIKPCRLPSLSDTNSQAPGVFKHTQCELGSSLTQRIIEICKRQNTTIASVMSGVWSLVLRAYVGTDSVCFGYISSGRDVPVPQVESIIGPLITMMVSRVDIDQQMPISDLLQNINGRFLESVAHQHCSLSQILHAAGEGRQRGQLFNTMVNVQKRGASMPSSATIGLELLDVYDPSEYDVSLDVEHNEDNVTLYLHYWTSFLSEEHAQLLHDTVLQGLKSLLDNISGTVGDITLFSQSHRSRLLEWAPEMPQTVVSCVHDLVDQRVHAHPKKEAVTTSNLSMTYQELDSLASCLARHLASRGVGPEVMVPFCFDKSPWAVVVMYAILKAGGACVALSPEYPDLRLASIIDSTLAKVVISDVKHAERFEKLVNHVVAVDGTVSRVSDMLQYLQTLDGITTKRAHPDNTAFVAFTSGSTGTPKGIILEHASISTSIHYQGATALMSSTSRVLQFSAYTFDASIEEIFTTLAFGGTVCVPSEYERMNELPEFMKAQKVNFADMTPTVAGLLNPDEISLATLNLGGEAVPQSLVRKWSSRTNLVITYGPSECSIACSGMLVETSELPDGALGKPAGSLMWIVDPNDPNKLAPIGCAGEILIEGPLLARGYIESGQTNQAFLMNPSWTNFVRIPGVHSGRRMYRTGDMARYNLDGSLIFFGRKDSQVKIHGQRIDLGEIEHHLLRECIGQATVLIPKQGFWKNKLVAVFAPENSQKQPNQSLEVLTTPEMAPLISELRIKLQDHVPGYMMPRAWIPMVALPVTPNGKLNRRQILTDLESMDVGACERVVLLERVLVPASPLNAVEKQFISVWAVVLAIPEAMVDITQPFFRLGGDSISAMHAATQLRSQGIRISVHDILRYRTIAALAELVAHTAQTTPSLSLHGLIEANETKDTPFPLTPIQTMYFQAHPVGENHFNQSSLLKLRHTITPTQAFTALMTLVQHHSMLNARFAVNSSGVWSQTIAGDTSQSLHFTSSVLTSFEDAKALLSSSHTVLDIQHGPLVAASLISVNSDATTDQFLYIVIHHLSVDLVSWRIILEDLEKVLLDQPLGPKPLSFQAWAIAQDAYAKQNLLPDNVLHFNIPQLDDQQNYWGMAARPNVYATVMELKFTIDSNTTSLLLGNANDALQTEPMEVILTLLLFTFSQTFQDRDLPAIFCEGHGRESPLDADLSRTVGWFTTMFPIWIPNIDSNGPLGSQFIQALRLVKDCRRLLPGKGWQYFTSRYLNERGRMEFSGHDDAEILFNFFGSTSLKTQRYGILEETSFDGVSHVNHNSPRSALFEISVNVQSEKLCFSFQYSREMKHQLGISSWIDRTQSLAVDAARLLGRTPSTSTLADYPFLGLKDYSALDILVEAFKFQLDISSCDTIQTVYPCAPMQEGILLSRSRIAGVYNVQTIWKVTPSSFGDNVDLNRLKVACTRVVSRHDILRTHFVEHHRNQSAFIQVVMKEVIPPVKVVKFSSVTDLEAESNEAIYRVGSLPYLFTICQTTNGDVYLRLDINHALIDGTSTHVLIRDLRRAYDEQLPAIGPVYGDFISHLHALPSEDSLAFWTEHLTGLTPSHFPQLTGLSSNENSSFKMVKVDLTQKMRADLHEFCKKHSTTLANVMSTVWALVLSCFVGTDSSTVTFGYLASGRGLPISGVDDILGPLITMIVRRTEIEPDSTVLNMISNMQEDLTRTWPHQHCSLGDIYHALNLNGIPLFNTIVNMQREVSGIEADQASISFQAETGHDPSEYDISFNIQDGKDIQLSLGYWNHCISEAQANVVSRTVGVIISSILANPHRPVSSVDFAGSYDIQTIESWNNSVPEPIDHCIHHAIELRAKLNPDSPAVYSIDPSVSLSYQELNNMADNMAQYLSTLGVGPESLVPFCLDKSHLTPVTMVAILKAGGACVALDPSQPRIRLQGIIRDSGANVIMSAPQYRSLFSDLVPHVVSVEETAFHQDLSSHNSTGLTSAVQYNNPAFVIFTSGSTGTPKGIVVEHGAFCSSARSHAPALRLGQRSRVLQFASHTYDLSIAENLTTLMVGGCICVPSEYQRLNCLAVAINAMQVDWMFLTPTVAALLHPDDVPTVKTLVLGGEHATQNNFTTWGSRPGVCLINSYGPAECAIWTNANVQVQANADTSNIGPRLGCSLWIVDPRNHHRLMPIGARGELVIGGPTLARGYLHNPVQTDAVFIQSPDWFKGASGNSQRFYKSGDLARYNLDGTLSIQGRKDTQVKVHGHRIELGDIDRNIAQIPSVEHVTVQLPRLGHAQDQLVALVSLNELPRRSTESTTPLKIITHPDHTMFATPILNSIRSQLEQQLPRHMLPNLWIIVERIPLLSSGKLDKQAVKAWLHSLDQETYNQARSLSQFEADPSSALPETPTELELQQIWADVLRCPLSSIPMTQSFLRVGGDSISAMQVVSRARAKGINIFVQDVLRLKTIRSLAQQATNVGTIAKPTHQVGRYELLTSKGEDLDRFIANCVARLDLKDSSVIEDIFPCSPMQEGILISQAKTHSNYQVKALFKVLVEPTQSVDLDKLEQAWALVAQRHQALRSILIEGAAGQANFLQVVLKEVTVPIRRLDCDSVEHFRGLSEINAYAEDGPPYRVSIFKTQHNEVYCQLAISHVLDDGSSMQVLIRDICLAYDNMLPSGPPPLYSNFISYIRGQSAEASLDFWKTYLDGLVPTHLPALQKTTNESPQTAAFNYMLEGEKVAKIHAFCERFDITVADIFKTVWALILASFLGTESVCFGHLASGRDTPIQDVHNIVGPLINMLVFRADIIKSTKVIDLLQEAHEGYIKALSHQYSSLKEISHAIGSGQTTLFNTLVNVQRATSDFFAHQADPPAQQTITLRNVDLDDPTEYDLSLGVMESRTQIHVILNYWTSFISSEQAASIGTIVLQVIDQIVADPFRQVRDLDFSNETDMALLHQWNPVVPADTGCLHKLFEKQVAKKPFDAVAVVSDNKCLTYKELDQMANQLAHLLVQKGARPDTIIPCCFEKSVWAIVAMLAILKSGAACLALDPTYPLERLQMMIEDTEASFVLTSPSHTSLMADVKVECLVVSFEALNTLANFESSHGPQTSVAPDNAAFVVYTSGSTGTPKGAVLEHRNLYATSRGLESLNMTSESRVAHFASYAFDVSIGETVLALTRGACVCIISDEDRLGDLSGAFNRLQVTWTMLTPTVLRMLEPQNVPNLRTVVLSGELLTDDIVAKWHEKVDLFNAYGPCECAITCCATEQLKAEDRGVNIGRPWQSNLWIVDAENHHRVVPIGAIGELCIEGPLVGRGYLKNASKTSASFIDASSWYKDQKSSSRRAYKTGDLARWNADGTISYMGRKDNQTKIQGQRIELGEIEYQISASAGRSVKAVVATVPKHGILKNRLIVLLDLEDWHSSVQSNTAVPFIQDESLQSLALKCIAEIKASVKKNLPRHMVPSLWFPVHRIPTLKSGKTNRRLISEWFESIDQATYTSIMASIQVASTAIPPSSEMEETLQKIWSQLLNLPKDSISMDQNFFAMGGDSVLAMQFIARCRAQGITTSLVDLFQRGTIAALAPCCTHSSSTDFSNDPTLSLLNQTSVQEGDVVLKDPSKVENIYPCTPMQESILSAQTKLKNSWYANWVMEVHPSSADPRPIEMDEVAKGWQRVVNRHSVLRTFFQSGSQSKKLYQIVLKEFNAPICYITSTAPDSVNPFDFTPGMQEDGIPPHRLVLAKTSGRTVLLQLQISHAIYDAISLSVLWHDLQVACSGDMYKSPAPSYGTFIKYLSGLDRPSAINFWKKHLAAIQPCQFPSLLEPSLPTSQQTLGSFSSAIVPFEKTKQARAFCKRHAVTTANLFQAAWALVLRHFTGMDSVCFGFMLSGRDAPIPEVNSVLGPFINLMPCMVKPGQETSLSTMFQDLQADFAEVLMNQNCSIADIEASLGMKKPLFNTFLNMQRVAGQAPYSQSSVQFHERSGLMTDEYSISVYVVDAEEGISISFCYWDSVLSSFGVEKVSSALLQALDLLFESNPDDSLSKLSLV